jgi:hypothetical protein
MYDQHFDLSVFLDAEPDLIQAPALYNIDVAQQYAALMDRLAQPLPTGQESPFSSRDPTTGHALLASAIAFHQDVLAQELNHVPDRLWILILRMLGTTLSTAEYPVINVVFRRTPDAIAANIPMTIPLNVEIRSQFNPNLSCYSITSKTAQGVASIGQPEQEGIHFVTVPCRLNQVNSLASVRIREFTVLPRSLPFVETAFNDGVVVNPGRPPETLIQAVMRTRENFKTGLRCVAAQDYHYAAKLAGAEAVNVMVGVNPGVNGYFGSLVSVAVYPPAVTSAVDAILDERVLRNRQIRVLPAEVIPVDGVLRPRVRPDLSNADVFNLVATAISTTVNPPHGKWGDQNFDQTVAIACEKQNGIFGVPEISLKHATTDQAIAELDIKPWHLLEVQSTLVVDPIRT